ncbi:alanine--tRNA ligase [bacterium]|nr:alanine--tRNA ligase [bacterium]
MKHTEIRQGFIDFFLNKGHVHIPSDSLIPRGDKTLLFTNAGMNQFKDIFLNVRPVTSARVVNSQKCMRVSGKHNDLEDVGKDTYHHTFFEMLGNWSFGDYYKREAILYAWELITGVWNLPKAQLWVTYYHDDHETEQLWKQETDVVPAQVLPFGEKDNFWEMGETGPCGPCSEIHIDLGPDMCPHRDTPGHICGVNTGCPRYIELWNLVFIQYNKDTQGTLTGLPKKHVDTGMGLERILSVLQGTYSNYETDLFLPIIEHNQQLSGVSYGQNAHHDISIRVIADHVRAVTFLIGDNVFPSNEGRGYVLRRILRRAVRHGKMLDLHHPFLYQLVETCIEIMGTAYPGLKQDPDRIIRLVKREEERFHQTLQRGFQVLEDLVERHQDNAEPVLSGQEMFTLYDTYGFPPDFTREILEEKGMRVDEQGFEQAMFAQKEKGRSGWDGAQQSEQQEQDLKRYADVPPTDFSGYECDRDQGRIVALYHKQERVQVLSEGQLGIVVLDRSPFYGESGGQIGDTGDLTGPDGTGTVEYTAKSPQGHILHQVKMTRGELRTGDPVQAQVAAHRRNNIRKNHTSTHLLQAVLKETLGDHVRQAGSLVHPEYFRFDFTHFDRLDPEQLETIQREINSLIMRNIPVETQVTTLQRAINEGAMALFDEKYGDQVRMVRVPGVSLELCGGTHVERTGDIGAFKVVHESGVAAGIRRIEGITGPAVLEWINRSERTLHDIAEQLKTSPDHLVDKVNLILEAKKELERELTGLRQKQKNEEIQKLLAAVSTVEGIKTVIGWVDNFEIDDLRTISDQLREKLEQGVVVLLTERIGKVIIVAAVTPDLTKRIHAGKLVGALAKIVGGGGGGRPDFAQAGGKDVSKIAEALERAPRLILDQLNT